MEKSGYTRCQTEDEASPAYEDSNVSDDTLLESKPAIFRNSQSRRRQLLRLVLIHLCYILFYSLVSGIFIRHIHLEYMNGPHLVYTPAREAIEYEVHQPMGDYELDGGFFGEPSPKVDRAWLDYLKYTAIHITKEEFKHYNKEGIALGDGSGYLATTTAYHDLHCIRYLQQTLYSDHYFPNTTVAEHSYRREHAVHCLKALKHSVTCRADLSIRTMAWKMDELLPISTDNPHECVRWQGVEDWMESRHINAFKPGNLNHPVFGPVFDEQGNVMNIENAS